MAERLDKQIGPLALLTDPIRRRIYSFVRDQKRAVTRDEVASGTGISRRLAAFHLDKLLEEGLLGAHFARPPGRSGRGAGRSAKYYQPSDVQIAVTIPMRRYDLAGTLLADAIRLAGPRESGQRAALRVARDAGARLGTEVRASRKLRRLGSDRTLAVAQETLEEHGYEPYRSADRSLSLRNCPFHDIARHAPELMCDMNRAFIDGLLRGLGNTSVEALLTCKPGDCCVTLQAPDSR